MMMMMNLTQKNGQKTNHIVIVMMIHQILKHI